MSRFKEYSPRRRLRPERSFEGDESTLRPHALLDNHNTSIDRCIDDASVLHGSSISSESSQLLEIVNQSSNKGPQIAGLNTTPWSRLNRLANTIHNPATPFPFRQSSIAFASNSSDSIQEEDEYSNLTRSPDSLQSISRSLQKIKRTPPISEGSTNYERHNDFQSLPNRTLFVAESDKFRKQDVAVGYMSPPESRQVSPDIAASRESNMMQKSIYRTNTSCESPTPTCSPMPRRTAATDMSYALSPKSRITRTLQEIQAELAESREGIEAIESRLEVLEKHESVSQEMIGKHVQDCIQSMAEELHEYDTSTSMVCHGTQDEFLDTYPQFEDRSREGFTLFLPISAKLLICSILAVLATEYLIMSGIQELGRQRIMWMT